MKTFIQKVSIFSIFVISILLISSTLAASKGPVAQAQTSSTPFRMTLPVPPNTLNELTIASGTSGYYIAELELAGTSPVVLPNGSFDWPQSITNSISHNANYTQWIFNVN